MAKTTTVSDIAKLTKVVAGGFDRVVSEIFQLRYELNCKVAAGAESNLSQTVIENSRSTGLRLAEETVEAIRQDNIVLQAKVRLLEAENIRLVNRLDTRLGDGC